ncbi:EamA family transporter [Nakamurella sp. YIM 132087]|uniref:EamA family transporter n=1 Tax=Nakamurella alba TaxID=2665158 RepID=A0A7K1FJ28_9ACTN|nr:DMT family transporter [Nakamurella alba]MTD14145.1 EamA family transporter [Nakamurella alba]
MKGPAAMAATVVLWAGFALSIRGIAGSSLTPVDVALLRFGLPVLVLLPVVPAAVRRIRRAPLPAAVAIACGAGLPYFLTSALGGRLTSATLVGLVIPGTVPVFVTAAVALRRRAMPSAPRLGALALVVAGVTVIAVPELRSGPGLAVLLAASAFWAAFTLGLRRAGLRPLDTVLLVCLPSLPVTVLLAVLRPSGSALLSSTAGLPDVLVFTAVQGIGIGLCAGLTYAVAVARLGPRPAAATGALTPVLVAAIAFPLFGERPTLPLLAGAVLVVAGVIAANTVPDRSRPVNRRSPTLAG